MDWTFAAPEPLDARLENASGLITVNAAPVAEATVSLEPMGRREETALEAIQDAEVTCDGRHLVVRLPKGMRRQATIRMAVVIPEGSALNARTASADIGARGSLGSVDVATASGDVDVTGEVGSVKADTASGDVTFASVRGGVEARSASGDLNFESVGGNVSVATASGDVELGNVSGDANVSTASGDVRVHRLGSNASIKGVSGDVELCLVERGDVRVSTTSGDIEVFVAKGVGTWLDLGSHSGDTSCSLSADDGAPGTADLRLTCQTLSGSIDVRSAQTSIFPAPDGNGDTGGMGGMGGMGGTDHSDHSDHSDQLAG